MLIFKIPTLNDNFSNFLFLFNLLNNLKNKEFDTVKFDFSQSNFLRSNAVAFLGGVYRKMEIQGKKVIFDWDTMSSKVRMNIRQNGFEHEFGLCTKPWKGNSIPYREDRGPVPDIDGIMNYLIGYWLSKGFSKISDKLANLIVGKIWEVYTNSFEHSNSEIGIFSCGQFFPCRNELILSVIDFGQSIPFNVKSHFKPIFEEYDMMDMFTQIPCYAFLQWAFKSGNTTVNEAVPRGIGLDLLKDFIQQNNGSFEIFSGKGYGIFSRDRCIFSPVEENFDGTLVHIKIQCDETQYILQ